MNNLNKFYELELPQNFLSIKSLDCHTGGEPLRIITSGFPPLKGNTVLEKRRYCRENHDDLRKSLMFEPRGHADMYGALVIEAERKDSHFGAIFLHNEGYSSMCGHAVIALSKFAVESGVVQRTGEYTSVKIDVPCGQIIAVAHFDGELIDRVTFECVPSYVHTKDATIELEEFGEIKLDIAFGGAYYAYVDVAQFDLSCDPKDYNRLIEIGRAVKIATANKYEINHPFEKDLGFLYGTIFVEMVKDQDIHSRNVCVFADGEVDRSPTGSGVSGRAAIHFLNGDIKLNESMTIESIIGSRFKVNVVKQIDYAGYQAVIPCVTGSAFVSGKNEWLIDPNDPFKDGFILR